MQFSELISTLKSGEAGLVNYKLASNPKIIRGASIEKALLNEISFIEKNNSLASELNQSKLSAVLIPDDKELRTKVEEKNIAWAILKDPKLGFAEVLELLNPIQKPSPTIHNSSVIGNNVEIGKNISIGPNTFIGNNCIIGDNTIIHPGVVIYDNVVIQECNELHANCVIHPGTFIGKNCVIHSNAVIGSEGFGFVPTSKGWRKMPQTGVVIVQDNVEVGCNTTIDRPAVGETLIGSGTKIDNLVQIGHGVSVGKGCAMAAQVGIAGGAVIGDSVILAGQVGVGNRVKVGDRVIASSKCGIHADIEPGQVISGFPAISNRLWLRCSANFKKLPEIAKAIRKLNLE